MRTYITKVTKYNQKKGKFEDINFKVCCKNMGKAVREGTDNEGYGALIDSFSFDKGYGIGSAPLPMANYCPWCGRKLNEMS